MMKCSVLFRLRWPPAYTVSIKLGSLQCSSSGFMRMMGPIIVGSDEVATAGKESRRIRTVSLVKLAKLPPGILSPTDDLVPKLISVRCPSKPGSREFGKGMKGDAIDGQDSCVKDSARNGRAN